MTHVDKHKGLCTETETQDARTRKQKRPNHMKATSNAILNKKSKRTNI